MKCILGYVPIAQYDAPEVFNRKRELKSDVWSLGVTLMELAEKENPLKGVSKLDAEDWFCNNDPPSLSSEKWSAEFVDFIRKCLVMGVKERWSVKQLMEGSLYYVCLMSSIPL